MSSNNAKGPTMVESKNSNWSKVGNWASEWGIITACIVTFVAMFGTAFGYFSSYVGSTNQWIDIQAHVQKVLLFTLFGTIALTMAAIFYFIQDSAKAMYFIIVMMCVSVGMSYAALSISAISKC